MPLFTRLNRTLARIAEPKDEIYDPLDNWIARYSTRPSMTMENRPRVSTEIGSDSSFKIGFSVTFKIDRIKAVKANAPKSEKSIDFMRAATTQRDRILTPHTINIFFITIMYHT